MNQQAGWSGILNVFLSGKIVCQRLTVTRAQQLFGRAAMTKRFTETDDRVDENGEGGPQGCIAFVLNKAGVKMSDAGSGKMTACRKPHDANAVRVNVPLTGIFPD